MESILREILVAQNQVLEIYEKIKAILPNMVEESMTEKIYTPSCKEESRIYTVAEAGRKLCSGQPILCCDSLENAKELVGHLCISGARKKGLCEHEHPADEYKYIVVMPGVKIDHLPTPVCEENPVNEACLFKPVMVTNDKVNYIEGLLIGISDNCFKNGANCFLVAITDPAVTTAKHGYNNVAHYESPKRIEGYDYGDGDE